jgi:Tfp pilus assembly protein FimV
MSSLQLSARPSGGSRAALPPARRPVLTLVPGGGADRGAVQARPDRGTRRAADGRAAGARRPAPPLRLTRRGRRLVAGLSVATGLGVAVLGVAVADGGSGGLQLAGDSSVVVRSGDTLWSIAADAAPEEDVRAVVDAIIAVNDLPGVGLVPGQVLQLP